MRPTRWTTGARRARCCTRMQTTGEGAVRVLGAQHCMGFAQLDLDYSTSWYGTGVAREGMALSIKTWQLHAAMVFFHNWHFRFRHACRTAHSAGINARQSHHLRFCVPAILPRILSTDIIVTLSLVGRAVMTFELDKGREAERRASRARVHLPPRCLQVGRVQLQGVHAALDGVHRHANRCRGRVALPVLRISAWYALLTC